MDVDAQVGGIVVAKEQSIEGFDEGYCQNECQQRDTAKPRQLFSGDVRKTAHAPHDIGMNIVGIGKDIC